MRLISVLFVLGLALPGCQRPSSSGNGLATLLVHVKADPKTGSGLSAQKVYAYDTTIKPVDRGAFMQVDYSDLDDIVVWLEPVAAGAPAAPDGPQTIDINPDKESPSLAAVVSVGQQLALHNASSSPQTIYSVSDGNDFDFESVPAGGEVNYTVRSPGLIEVLASSSTEKSVKVYAAPSPWVRMTRAGRTLLFNKLSPGQYRLFSWHPRLPGSQTDVRLTANQTTEASIDVSVNSLPKVGSHAPG
jgi:hypothetical protein